MLKENQISDLINQSGRLRMLSHRASMIVAQIGAGMSDNWYIDELAISIEKFEKGYGHILEIIESEPLALARFEALITEATEDKTSISEHVTRYLSGIKQYQIDVKYQRRLNPDVLSDFVKFVATDLLVALNTIVVFFETVLNDVATAKLKKISGLAKTIEDSLEEVDKINLNIKILSFNASIEAARAGEIGKGFAVVSKEMTSLSSNTQQVTQKIKDTVDSFVEHLHE